MTAFFDTSILLYSISTNDREAPKRSIARTLLMERDCALSVQVLNEFVWQSTRPHKDPGVSFETAFANVAALRRFPVQSLDLAVHELASKLLRELQLSWWDCLIVAAAQEQGCDILYSEDMRHGQIIDRLTIVNPFA